MAIPQRSVSIYVRLKVSVLPVPIVCCETVAFILTYQVFSDCELDE